MNNVLFVKIFQSLKNLFNIRIELFLFQYGFFAKRTISIFLIKRLIELNTIGTGYGIYRIWKKIWNLFLDLFCNMRRVLIRMLVMLGRCVCSILRGKEFTVVAQHKILLFSHCLLFLNKLTYTTKIIRTQLHNNVRIFRTT